MRSFLDTHAAMALHDGRRSDFGSAARARLAEDELAISPVVKLELALLYEIGRIRSTPDATVGRLLDLGVHVVHDPIDTVVERSLALTWTRDPFDRLIVATCLLHGSPLITRDRRITGHFPGAVW